MGSWLVHRQVHWGNSFHVHKESFVVHRTVSHKEGSDLAASHECCGFFETSAADDQESVERAVHALVRDVLHCREVSLQVTTGF